MRCEIPVLDSTEAPLSMLDMAVDHRLRVDGKFSIDYSHRASEPANDRRLLQQLIVEHADDLFSVENSADQFVYVSPGAAPLFGWAEEELLGIELQALLHAEDRRRVADERAGLRSLQRPSLTCRYRLRCGTGEYRWVESRSRLGLQCSYVVTVTRDIDDHMRQVQELERLATYDALTNLLNRRAIELALQAELSRSRRHAQPLSVALFDIDGFKRVNDSFGHLAGDSLLCTLAGCIERNRRVYDVLGRFGGDEFLLAMPNTDAANAREIVNRLRESVACELPGTTLSFGISSNADDVTLYDLLNQADTALYRGKRLGGNRVVLWQPTMLTS